MPQRGDLKKILILGSGPIVIGQACEFDYSGTQACKALRNAGYEIVLINSNPASIMTDPEIASKTYIEPLTPEIVSQIILKEKPDAILPTMGGQTALNLAVKLSESDFLKQNNIELIGADLRKPKLHKDFNFDNKSGLSTVLINKTELKSVINKTEIDNLDLILSGPIPPNPAELLDSSKMLNVIKKLEKTYDYIIIDTPPVGLVTDALIIMKFTDINLYLPNNFCMWQIFHS